MVAGSSRSSKSTTVSPAQRSGDGSGTSGVTAAPALTSQLAQVQRLPQLLQQVGPGRVLLVLLAVVVLLRHERVVEPGGAELAVPVRVSPRVRRRHRRGTVRVRLQGAQAGFCGGKRSHVSVRRPELLSGDGGPRAAAPAAHWVCWMLLLGKTPFLIKIKPQERTAQDCSPATCISPAGRRMLALQLQGLATKPAPLSC